MRGFSFNEFAAVGFHPLRLLETPFPLSSGRPVAPRRRGGSGASRSRRGTRPTSRLSASASSLSRSRFSSSSRPSGTRDASGSARPSLSLLAALVPWLPGAPAVYAALPVLHVVRYPVKAIFVLTLSVAVLAALATDRLLILGSLPALPGARRTRPRRPRGASRRGLSLALRLSPDSARSLLLRLWDPSWVEHPPSSSAPSSAGSRSRRPSPPPPFSFSRSSFAGRRRTPAPASFSSSPSGWSCSFPARGLLPRIPSAWLETRFPLVSRAAGIPGRVFERTGKDLDPVRRGLLGVAFDRRPDRGRPRPAPSGVGAHGRAAGTPVRLRPDPDGSYSYLDRMAQGRPLGPELERQAEMAPVGRRRKRHRGRRSSGDAGPRPRLHGRRGGDPGDALPADGAASGDPALPARPRGRLRHADGRPLRGPFLRPEGGGRRGGTERGLSRRRPRGPARPRPRRRRDRRRSSSWRRRAACRASCTSTGPTRRCVRATVNRRPVVPVVANLHLVGIPVPAGLAQVVVEIAP